MPRAVLVKLSAVSGTVTNVIVADAKKDFAPDKYSILVSVPDDHPADVGWTWDEINGFTPAELVAKPLAAIDTAPLSAAIVKGPAQVKSTVPVPGSAAAARAAEANK